jgi:hypothetical protein
MAAEALRELRGLVVADAGRHAADRNARVGEQVACVPHPHRRQHLAEAGVADLGERALKLAARGRELAGHALDSQRTGVVALDHRHGLPVQLRPSFLGAFSHRHAVYLSLDVPW